MCQRSVLGCFLLFPLLASSMRADSLLCALEERSKQLLVSRHSRQLVIVVCTAPVCDLHCLRRRNCLSKAVTHYGHSRDAGHVLAHWFWLPAGYNIRIIINMKFITEWDFLRCVISADLICLRLCGFLRGYLRQCCVSGERKSI